MSYKYVGTFLSRLTHTCFSSHKKRVEGSGGLQTIRFCLIHFLVIYRSLLTPGSIISSVTFCSGFSL